MIEEWCLKLWLIDDPETEEYSWNVDATIDGYHSLGFEDDSIEKVLNKAIEFCKHTRWTDLW